MDPWNIHDPFGENKLYPTLKVVFALLIVAYASVNTIAYIARDLGW